MKTGILFDLDGTLLDTLEDLLDATNHALAAFGYPPRTLPELRRFVGNGAENQIRLSLPENQKEDLSKVLAVYKPYYTDHCQIKTKPYEGILPALKALEEKLNALMQDPQLMQQIASMAQAMTAGQKSEEQSSQSAQVPDPGMMQMLSGFAGQTNIDCHQQALLQARNQLAGVAVFQLAAERKGRCGRNRRR